MVPSLTHYVPITFPPSQLGSPDLNLSPRRGFGQPLLGNIKIFPSKKNFFLWSKTTLGTEGSGTGGSATLLQPRKSFGSPQKTGDVGSAAAVAERRGLTCKAAPPGCTDWKCDGKPLTSSPLASHPPTAMPWLSLSPPLHSHTSGPPPGNIPPWRQNAGGNASTCLGER